MMMAHFPQVKDSEGVADKVIELLWPYRKNALTITTDNGGHVIISEKPHTTLYIANSYASWQKGR